jgi:hypothetical protein
VAVIGLTAKDVTGHISIVQALHDDHDRRLLVIEAVGHRFAGDLVRVGKRDVTHVGQVAWAPLPGGPEHVHQEALHEAWGHVDQQPVAGDVAERDRLQVQADRLDHPTLDHGARLRLKGVPKVAHEVEEAAPTCLLAP